MFTMVEHVHTTQKKNGGEVEERLVAANWLTWEGGVQQPIMTRYSEVRC